jgi:KipI family sensor histidine kinase inhibitor
VSRPRVLPLGDAAVTVELGDSLDLRTNGRVRALDRRLALSPFDGFRESVPTLRSLLVLYDPTLIRFAALERELRSRLVEAEGEALPSHHHRVPTVYGGAAGTDLADFARARALDPAEVVRLHASRDYTAFMLGFTPGFAYLGLLPDGMQAGRHASPRVRVPAGSVAIAGRLTAVYPVASPGGWQLIGRTSLRLFDPFRDEPARIAPGDRVRFVPVAELPEPEPATARPAPEPALPPALEVLEPGLLTSVQDAGRVGRRRFGVATAGAVDRPALAAANRALGNAEHAAALECTVTGPALRFEQPLRFAIAGADLGAVLERADLGPWPVPLGAGVLARPGNVLRFRGRVSGCRALVALAGGVEEPPVLGSRSTDLQSGFGGHRGRALRVGDVLWAGRGGAGRLQDSPVQPHPERVTVRVVLGPQADHLEAGSVASFLSTTWGVGASSDRVGCRLDGPRLRHAGRAEILSDGMVPGSVQVPPDGRPIVMLADAPTTGGYPKLATILSRDLPRLGQLVPGAGEVRFEAVTVEEAQE